MATVNPEAPAAAAGGRPRIALKTPRDLYLLWERQQWQSQAIDFTQDREDWEAIPDLGKKFLIWNLATFFIGEERVATAFAPVTMSAEDEDEGAYLATQQVDEARHMQFFDRFWHEVVEMGTDTATLHERLGEARASVNHAFADLFDEHLMNTVDALRVDPTNIEAKVRAVTIYHMIAEGTVALTGQHFLTEFVTRAGILPGFAEGFANVARDEHRHVAYGTWFLREKCTDNPRLTQVAHDTMREMLPLARAVLTPPGVPDGSTYETPFGYSSADINRHAVTTLARRLKIVGIGLPRVDAPRPAVATAGA